MNSDRSAQIACRSVFSRTAKPGGPPPFAISERQELLPAAARLEQTSQSLVMAITGSKTSKREGTGGIAHVGEKERQVLITQLHRARIETEPS